MFNNYNKEPPIMRNILSIILHLFLFCIFSTNAFSEFAIPSNYKIHLTLVSSETQGVVKDYNVLGAGTDDLELFFTYNNSIHAPSNEEYFLNNVYNAEFHPLPIKGFDPSAIHQGNNSFTRYSDHSIYSGEISKYPFVVTRPPSVKSGSKTIYHYVPINLSARDINISMLNGKSGQFCVVEANFFLLGIKNKNGFSYDFEACFNLDKVFQDLSESHQNTNNKSLVSERIFSISSPVTSSIDFTSNNWSKDTSGEIKFNFHVRLIEQNLRLDDERLFVHIPKGQFKKENKIIKISRDFKILKTKLTASMIPDFSKIKSFMIGVDLRGFHSTFYSNSLDKFEYPVVIREFDDFGIRWGHRNATDVINHLNKYNPLCLGYPSDPKGCYRIPTDAELEYVSLLSTTSNYASKKPEIIEYAFIYPSLWTLPNNLGLYDLELQTGEYVRDDNDSTENVNSHSFWNGTKQELNENTQDVITDPLILCNQNSASKASLLSKRFKFLECDSVKKLRSGKLKFENSNEGYFTLRIIQNL
jgi:hypothetical protein